MGIPTPEWFVIELSDQGELAGYPELLHALHQIFGEKIRFFIPIYYKKMGSYISTNILFEGYAFVEASPEIEKLIPAVRDSRYFTGALKANGKFCLVKGKEIENLRKKLMESLQKNLQIGSKVKVLEGIFQNLEGEVLSIEKKGKVANIQIRCLSREIIAPIPTTCVEEVFL